MVTTRKVILVLCLTLASCDQSDGILAGYRAVEVDDGSVMLVRGQFAAIPPHVAKYRLLDHYIIGLRKEPFDPETMTGKLGYFIINTNNNEIMQGLTQDDLINSLSELGLEFDDLLFP